MKVLLVLSVTVLIGTLVLSLTVGEGWWLFLLVPACSSSGVSLSYLLGFTRFWQATWAGAIGSVLVVCSVGSILAFLPPEPGYDHMFGGGLPTAIVIWVVGGFFVSGYGATIGLALWAIIEAVKLLDRRKSIASPPVDGQRRVS